MVLTKLVESYAVNFSTIVGWLFFYVDSVSTNVVLVRSPTLLGCKGEIFLSLYSIIHMLRSDNRRAFS